MIGMKPKYAINLDIAELDKSETYAKEEVLLEDCSQRYLYQPAEQHGDKKNELMTSSGVKLDMGQIEL